MLKVKVPRRFHRRFRDTKRGDHRTSIKHRDKIRPKCWGANKEEGLLPFQLAFHIDKYSETKLEGATIKTIQIRSEDGYQLKVDTKCLFFPNDIETAIDTKTFTFPIRVPVPHPDGEHKHRLANIFFCYVDIDCKTDQERYEALDRIDNALIQPSVVVATGNGFHAYFSIKKISLLGLEEKERSSIEKRFKAVQEVLRQEFKGDDQVSPNITSKLRIPGTWNIKNGTMAKVQYYYGDLTTARSSPAYTLEGLEELLGLSSVATITIQEATAENAITSKPQKRPKPKQMTRGLFKARMKFQTHFSLQLSKREAKLFNYIFGFRNLDFYLEDKDVIGLNGADLKKARDKLMILGVIKLVTPHSIKKKRAAQYVPTVLFFNACGVSKSFGAIKSSWLRSIDRTPYGKGERITGVEQDYLCLRNRGVSAVEARKFIEIKIKERQNGLPHDTSILDWWEKRYKPYRQ
jgi:hypothetical protein